MGEYLWVFLSFIGSVWVLGITQLWGIPGPICSRALQFCVEVAGAYSLMQTSISHLLQMIHLAGKRAKYWVDQFATVWQHPRGAGLGLSGWCLQDSRLKLSLA